MPSALRSGYRLRNTMAVLDFPSKELLSLFQTSSPIVGSLTTVGYACSINPSLSSIHCPEIVKVCNMLFQKQTGQ